MEARTKTQINPGRGQSTKTKSVQQGFSQRIFKKYSHRYSAKNYRGESPQKIKQSREQGL